MKRALPLFIALFSLTVASSPVYATNEVFRIEVGKSYESYSTSDLKRRVWELERAVSQLQAQVFHLAMNNQPLVAANQWTCRITSFMKSYDDTKSTKTAALVSVIKKCSEGTNAIHCKEEDVKCSNE